MAGDPPRLSRAKCITCTHQFCPYSMESVNTLLLQMTSWKEKTKLSQGAAEPESSTPEPAAPPLPSSLPLSLAGAVEATLPAEGEGQAACQGHRKGRELCRASRHRAAASTKPSHLHSSCPDSLACTSYDHYRLATNCVSSKHHH